MVDKGVSMSKDINILNNVDDELVSEFKDESIKHHIATKLEFNINIAGTDFTDIEEAINHAYRCGLAAMTTEQFKKTRGDKSAVDQDELYKVLKQSHSLEHKADFLREIAKEWFPIELHSEKQIKTVHIELNELADFLKK
jgi:hypothetical protein